MISNACKLALLGLAGNAIADEPMAMGQLRGMSKRRVISLWAAKIESDDPGESLFAQALRTQANRAPVPDKIYEHIVAAMSSSYMRSGGNATDDMCPEDGCTVPIKLADIWGYGCWCNFGDELGWGRGPTLDEYDHVCNLMMRCNKCAKMDAEDRGDVCDPKTESFNANLRWDKEQFALVADCSAENDNDCGVHLCSCETTFIANLIKALWTDNDLVPGYAHSNTTWDGSLCVPQKPEETLEDIFGTTLAPTTVEDEEADESEMFCCGLYPDRYSYNSALWGCCDAPYNKNRYRLTDEICCANGDVFEIGTGQSC